MPVQIDFLPVPSGEKSGDAIAFRYGNLNFSFAQKVVIIDGGTLESGEALVQHINEHYNTNIVDLVVCTHPDADHASGLRIVLEKCEVLELWVHKPWEHSEYVCHLFQDGRITDNSLSERIKKAYTFAYELVQIAERKGIPTREPFAGRQTEDGMITILGPTLNYYRSLIPEFTKTPEAKESLLEKVFDSMLEKAITWIEETFDTETLSEEGETSAENRSSAVLLLQSDKEKFLFTGDAGILSMHEVIKFSRTNSIDISRVRFMQAPHHGSKRNLAPSILNSIRCETAFISASKESKKHPSRKVLNAYTRRGTKVYSTEGLPICHNLDAVRPGWSSITPHPFYSQVED